MRVQVFVRRDKVFCIYRSLLANAVYSLFSGSFSAACVPSLYPEYEGVITVRNSRRQTSDNHNMTCRVQIDLLNNTSISVN
jgi:hypothetical protein